MSENGNRWYVDTIGSYLSKPWMCQFDEDFDCVDDEVAEFMTQLVHHIRDLETEIITRDDYINLLGKLMMQVD